MLYNQILEWWNSKQIQTSDDLEVALDNFKIVFAYHSNGIEGSSIDYHTTREIFEGKPLSNYNGTAREIFEAQNQKFAYDFILESFDIRKDIDLAFILQLHSILLYGCYDSVRWGKGERPGMLKKHDYCVGLSEVGSFPEDTENDLLCLINDLSENAGSTNLLLKAAYFHSVFETIHPFADGNGRVGRTLLNYYLILNQHPPIVIFNEDKDTYYLALEVFNKTEELSGFVKFLQEQTVKTWKSRVKGTQRVKSLSSFL